MIWLLIVFVYLLCNKQPLQNRTMQILPPDYFLQKDTLGLAKGLLGKILITCIDGKLTSGRIVETEAYLGVPDKASHAYGGRRTPRTEVMYLPGGHAYVYLCYGIHHLFNIVTNQKNTPHAILIRAIEPLEGIETMMARRGKKQLDETLTRGPGCLSQALGITTRFSGHLLGREILVADDGATSPVQPNPASGPRIGVGYAAEYAPLPWRFFVKANPFVSKPNL